VDSAAEPVVAALDRVALATCVMRLPDDLRHILLLRYYAGLSVREVAHRMDLPEGTVRRRCYDARRLLRQRLVRGRLPSATGEDAVLSGSPLVAVSGGCADPVCQRLGCQLTMCPACRRRRAQSEATVRGGSTGPPGRPGSQPRARSAPGAPDDRVPIAGAPVSRWGLRAAERGRPG
jgi:hypothetical protein